MTLASVSRRLPVGTEPVRDGGVHARVWAPRRRSVEAVLEGGPGSPGRVALEPEPGGYFSGLLPGAAAGTRYRFALDGEPPLADPASRFQPEGPEGPSEVVDPEAFAWSDAGWRGCRLAGQVLYELHVGTFTPEGTYAAATERLPHLRDLGVTAVELMPLADWAGRYGWGYDGVCLYAPTRNYGTPDDLRRFVDAAHAHGIGVVLDVVYNHLGPRGAVLHAYADGYFRRDEPTDWGDAIAFDGEGSGPVRELFVANAGYWIAEYHLDGLRLDATQDIHDAGTPHVLAEIAGRAREAAGGRSVLLLVENEPQDVRALRPPPEGWGCDALWNDDLHHVAVVALTGRRQAYYTDYTGTPQELISAARWGFLYQGQRYAWQRARRGTPSLRVPAPAIVTFLENHDQVANTACGLRLHAASAPGCLRAVTAHWLLAPGTPMLFQGQEFAASAPFLFFADHDRDLAAEVRSGRREFLSQFRNLALAGDVLPDPCDLETFARCKLDWNEVARHAEAVALHRDLLRLRREDPVLRRQDAGSMHGAILGPQAFLLRHLDDGDDDRLVLVNLGSDLRLDPAPEPLLAPPAGRRWDLLWSSEEPAYGGAGAFHPERRDVTAALDAARAYEESQAEVWHLPGQATVVLRAVREG